MSKNYRDELDFITMRNKALDQLRSGESLTGEGGVFSPLLKEFVESALAGEMAGHLDTEERMRGNKRNGKGHKDIEDCNWQHRH